MLGGAFREVLGEAIKKRKRAICWFRVVEETTEVLRERLLQYRRIRLIMSEWNIYDTLSRGIHSNSKVLRTLAHMIIAFATRQCTT